MTRMRWRMAIDQFVLSLLNAEQRQRYAVVSLLVFLQCVQFTSWFVLCAYWPAVSDYVQAPLLRRIMPLELFLTLLVLGATYKLWNLPARVPVRVAQALPYVITFGYMFITQHYIYLLGTMSMGVGLLAVGSLLFGLVMVQRTASYLAMILGAILTLGMSAASNLGYLVYAPIFSDQAFLSHGGRMFQFASVQYFFVPHALVVIVLLDFLVHGLLRQQNKLRFLSEHDGLTGLLNRRTVTERMIHLGDFSEQGYPAAVILLDLDLFKKINDQHGHIAGDRVLRAASTVLQEHAIADRIVGRFGGEEFILVLPHCTDSVALMLAEQIRQQLMQLRVADDDNGPIAITASFGVAVGRLYPHQPEIRLIHQADQALYLAKLQGRNQVVLFQAQQVVSAEQWLESPFVGTKPPRT